MPTVREVMSKDLVTVERAATVSDAAAFMWAQKVGSALVIEEGRLLGIFTERDILKSMTVGADRGRTMTVREWMTFNPATIDAEATVGEALDRMLEGSFRHLPVMEGDQVIGVVSMRDLSQSIAGKP
ncbi:MAG TPA: CBS domain-containing protein [Actinomycetota bacterium]|jgi:CBS domain-containing protein